MILQAVAIQAVSLVRGLLVGPLEAVTPFQKQAVPDTIPSGVRYPLTGEYLLIP